MTDCLFCKILNKEIPNYTVYEDDFVLAFLDIFPHAKGHTVVIPKRHVEILFDLSDEETEKYFLGVKKAMEKIEAVLKPSGFNVGWNQKPVAGQVIPHLHTHIFPRYEGDGGGSVHSIIKSPGGLKVEEIYKSFK